MLVLAGPPPQLPAWLMYISGLYDGVLRESLNSLGADIRRPLRWVWKGLPPLAISCLVRQDLGREMRVWLSRILARPC